LGEAELKISELTKQVGNLRSQLEARERAMEQSSEIVAEITVEKQQLQEASKQQIQQLSSSISSLQASIE
jgi:predicted nuclease with TOPRIM domain